MTDYISVPAPIDREAVRLQMVADFQATTGATVAPGTPWDVFFDVIAGRVVADIGQQVSEVTNLVFRRYGELIMRVFPNGAVAAEGTITITAVDDDGPYLVPAGTELSVQGLDGERIAFYTAADAVIENGDTTIAGVPVVAGITGEAGNGLTADARLEISLADIESIALDGPTVRGVDGETPDEYINRLADTSPLQAITLVRADDYARYARTYPGVGDALALDNYNADTDTEDEPGVITVAVRGDDGADPGGTLRTALQADLEDRSVSDLEVFVIAPTLTAITVTRTVVPRTGYTQEQADDDADAAIAAFLDPAAWPWDETIVRFQDLVTAINNAVAVSHYTALTLNAGTADITLTGPAGLPDPA